MFSFAIAVMFLFPNPMCCVWSGLYIMDRKNGSCWVSTLHTTTSWESCFIVIMSSLTSLFWMPDANIDLISHLKWVRNTELKNSGFPEMSGFLSELFKKTWCINNAHLMQYSAYFKEYIAFLLNRSKPKLDQPSGRIHN